MEYTEALALGLKRYNTGRPCKHGHMADRITGGRTCTVCRYIAREAWRQRNPEKQREQSRLWARNRRAWGYNDVAKERMRNYYRKKKGIPEATRRCPTHCENCTRELLPGKTHLDHDHQTGAFRGWLCNRCNLGLGSLGDTVEALELALAYLKRAKTSAYAQL